MKRFNNIILVLIVLSSVLLIFYRGLFNFYFQDDFIHLSLGWLKPEDSFWDLFKIIEHFPYRPVAIQLFSFIAVYVFNLNPLPAHMILFLLHMINIVLLWQVLDDFMLGRFQKFVIVFLYGISSVHFMLFYWWSILFMILGTTFFLLNLKVLERIEERPTKLKLSLYFFLLILMLVTNESLFIFPVFVFIYGFFFKKKQIKKLIVPSFLTSFAFVILRIYFFAKYPLSTDYKIGNFLEIAKTFRWFSLRALNLPEGIREMESTGQKSVFSLFGLFLSLLLLEFFKNLKFLRRKNLTLFLFGVSWYLIFAFPFFLLPRHISPFYLNTALIGFFVAVVNICFIYRKATFGFRGGYGFAILSLFFYFLLSYFSADFLHKTHWVVWRSQIAKKYIEKVKRKYPILEKGATVVFKDTKVAPSEISVVLSGNKALRLYYKDPSLKVIYAENKDSFLGEVYTISE